MVCFRCLGGKLLENNQSLWLLHECLWGWKAAALSPILGKSFCFMRKMLWKCGRYGRSRIMQIHTTASWQMPCYKSYDCTSTYLYSFLCCCSSILCVNSNCMLSIIKKGGAFFQKNRNFTSVLSVLPIFFLMCGWGLALAMHAQCRVVEFRCSSSLFHQYSGTKCCKTAYGKIPSTKIP